MKEKAKPDKLAEALMKGLLNEASQIFQVEIYPRSRDGGGTDVTATIIDKIPSGYKDGDAGMENDESWFAYTSSPSQDWAKKVETKAGKWFAIDDFYVTSGSVMAAIKKVKK